MISRLFRDASPTDVAALRPEPVTPRQVPNFADTYPTEWTYTPFEVDDRTIRIFESKSSNRLVGQHNPQAIFFLGFKSKAPHPDNARFVERLNEQGIDVTCIELPDPQRDPAFIPAFRDIFIRLVTDEKSPLLRLDRESVIIAHSVSALMLMDILRDPEHAERFRDNPYKTRLIMKAPFFDLPTVPYKGTLTGLHAAYAAAYGNHFLGDAPLDMSFFRMLGITDEGYIRDYDMPTHTQIQHLSQQGREVAFSILNSPEIQERLTDCFSGITPTMLLGNEDPIACIAAPKLLAEALNIDYAFFDAKHNPAIENDDAFRILVDLVYAGCNVQKPEPQEVLAR